MVECRSVEPIVAGSNPVTHPMPPRGGNYKSQITNKRMSWESARDRQGGKPPRLLFMLLSSWFWVLLFSFFLLYLSQGVYRVLF